MTFPASPIDWPARTFRSRGETGPSQKTYKLAALSEIRWSGGRRQAGLKGFASMKKVMLALSTFRQSETAVEAAIERAAGEKALLVVAFVVDVNVARYLLGTDVGFFPNLRDRCEQDFLQDQKRVGEDRARTIVEKAAGRGVEAKSHVVIGRFGLECVKMAETEKPQVIVTTRSKRPGWVRRFFGSPVDYLMANAGCPVIEA